MTYLTREQWQFQGPLGPPMALPAPDIWLHHSVTVATADPAADMRKLEAIGKSRFGRLSYSFAIHPRGVILEGQGLHIGAHTQDHNSTSFGIVLIGNYEEDDLTDEATAALVDLLVMIEEEGWGPNQITGGHRDLKATACPGGKAYAAIPTVNDLARRQAELEQEEGVMPYRESDRRRDEATAELVKDIHETLDRPLGGLKDHPAAPIGIREAITRIFRKVDRLDDRD